MENRQHIFVVPGASPVPTITTPLSAIFGDHVNLLVFPTWRAAVDATDNVIPSLLILELTTDNISHSLSLLRFFRASYKLHDVPVLAAMPETSIDLRPPLVEVGVTDFLSLPYDAIELKVRCQTLLRLNRQQSIIRDKADWLEGRVRSAVKETNDREKETLKLLAKAGEFRDEETGNHINRLASYSRLIAQTLNLPREQCNLIEQAAPMHDIGKIGIPDHILLKPGRHTAQEKRLMQKHTVIGYNILKDSKSKYVRMGATIALCHHERFDGSGYPDRLSGTDIPLSARIVAVADVYDALTSTRPYKTPWLVAQALKYLEHERGKHFDPDCVDAFLCHSVSLQSLQKAV
ncbi:MAG: HD domain-containing protein [Gammaproteobacteria bacterium]|nr:HD domain-containing protein [Gammaproteobacteria bacterium]